MKKKEPTAKELRVLAQQAFVKLHPDYPDAKSREINWSRAHQYLRKQGLVQA